MLRIESIFISREPPAGEVVCWGKPTDEGIVLMLRNRGQWQPFLVGGEATAMTLAQYLKKTEAEDTYAEDAEVRATYATKKEVEDTYATKDEVEEIKGNAGITPSVSDETLEFKNK